MKVIIPALVISLLASCTAYQVMIVSSRDVPQNKASEFVVDNDSLELCYNFNGKDGPIKVMIRNKLDKPIYIDWKRSALVVNDRAVSYANGKVSIEGSMGGGAYNWGNGWSSNFGVVSATAQLPADMEFIPPHTYITKTLLGITNQTVEGLPDSIFAKKRIPAMGDGYETIKFANFSADNSPLVFRSYLSMIVGDSIPRPITYQHQFYVSELVRMINDPVALNGDRRGDRFYVVQGGTPDSITVGYGVVGGRAILQRIPVSKQ